MIKSLLKSLARLVALVLVTPLLMGYGLARLFLPKNEAFAGASEWASLCPGVIGSYIRVALLRVTLEECSADCRVMFGVLFSKAGARIGRGVYVGPRSSIGLVTLEDDVLLGPNVHVLSGANTHGTSDSEVPFRDQAGNLQRVTIGRGAWVGAGSIIMADVGPGAVVGAGTVVTRAVPPRVVAAGSPAKVLRELPPVPAETDSVKANPAKTRSDENDPPELFDATRLASIAPCQANPS